LLCPSSFARLLPLWLIRKSSTFGGRLAILLSVQRPAFVPEEPWVDITRSNRFIILGILIISTVFSLVWPEDARTIARQKLAASLQAIACLLNIRGGSESNPEREQLELEIASHLAEANASQEQAAFEALTHSPAANQGLDLENAAAAVEEVYVACLPWLREQAASASAADRKAARRAPNIVQPLVHAVEASAALIEDSSNPNLPQGALTLGDSLQERGSIIDASRSFERFEQLVAAVKELQAVVSAPLRARS